ncbi:MAG: YHS domain-containing (seleno)protein [Crocinitomicaceae bacterium]
MKKLMLAFGLLVSALSFGQSMNVKSVALDGYDLVAYFAKNQAIQGTNKLSAEVDGIHYFFSSVENQKTFEANPSKYMPQCGGFCATGVATANAKFPVDPENFVVTDGKLYLFYNGPYQGDHFNGKDPWMKDQTALIKKASSNWSALKSK